MKEILMKDIFAGDKNEEGRYAILLSLVPMLTLTLFSNAGLI